ncbi:hypothetical protein BBP40_009567 [Aspergillus hancockii]|nr:hypothetical protein BBP40_009567 [Aspergillus hancockii]
MFSSVTGAVVDSDSLDDAYWIRNLMSPVRFTNALNPMRHDISDKGTFSNMVVIEVGPHPALQSAIRDTMGAGITYRGLLTRHGSGTDNTLTAVSELSCEGVPVDILRVNEAATPTSHKPDMLFNLPSYHFSHNKRIIYEDHLSRNTRLSSFSRHSILGAPVADWDPHCPRWRQFLSLSGDPWLKDHMIESQYVLLGAAYVTMAIEASRQIADRDSKVSGFRPMDVYFNSLLVIPDSKEGIEVYLSLSPFTKPT